MRHCGPKNPTPLAVLLRENHRRAHPIPMRPDHGQRMLDDLEKPLSKMNPGYPIIGRMKGVAELTGFQVGLGGRYNALFQTAWSSLKTLCAGQKYLGADAGAMAVLHTWGQNLHYHPHLHFLVPAGGLSFNGQCWKRPKSDKFLVPVRALSRLFRGRLVSELRALHREAMMYSFFASCKYAGVNSWEWLADVLGRIGTHPVNRLEELLPGRWAKK